MDAAICAGAGKEGYSGMGIDMAEDAVAYANSLLRRPDQGSVFVRLKRSVNVSRS